ncbi:SPOR domain-containing protein [Alteromonas lipotrueiana]|uniref:SPOR domain-containing protein n=1 Tax=Alteromonas lipotrueiana TaxID=2803815 RepID=UPI001C45EDE0|nr:SPOR domain-containing protein [Alteromonas lipotrueiana]|tara:strand:+ start:1118 stop:1696 length:579 start_codon:yes stop_codon:yes gene_type:complete
MAQRDYVSRGRGSQGPNKKNNKKPSRRPQTKGPKTPRAGRLAAGVVFFLVLGFIWFLWSIKDSAEEQVDGPVSAPSAVKQEDELPEMPEEEWEYIKSLPGYEVEVEVARQEKSDKLYLLQCGSFRTRPQAEEMKAKIAFQGLEAQIRDSSGSNGNWFRVILGPLQTKRDAERAKHTLRKINITTCIILTWSV